MTFSFLASLYLDFDRLAQKHLMTSLQVFILIRRPVRDNLLEEPPLLRDLVWTWWHENNLPSRSVRHALPGMKISDLGAKQILDIWGSMSKFLKACW